MLNARLVPLLLEDYRPVPLSGTGREHVLQLMDERSAVAAVSDKVSGSRVVTEADPSVVPNAAVDIGDGVVLTERKFDIAKMLRDVVDEQRSQAENGNVTMTLHAPSQGWIVGDSHMLWMVAENLVSNAIKYTPPGGVVAVRLVRRANRWVLTVKDTGVGISKSDYSKLFKQFSRIANARSDFVTGTGVGLYLAQHLTVLHGGTIGVTSTKGKGSTFTVRLPRKM